MGLRLSLMRANTNKPPCSQAAWRKQMLPYKSDHDSAPGGGGESSSGDVWKPQLPNMLASIVSVHMIQLSSCLLVLLCLLSKLRSFLNWWFWEATSTIWREHLSLEHDVTCFLKKQQKTYWDEKSCCKSANVHLNKKKDGGGKNRGIELEILNKESELKHSRGFSGKPHIYI